MKARPILFSGPMIRALLAGTKTQTRRIAKLPPESSLGVWEPSTLGGEGVTDGTGNCVAEHAVIWHTRSGTTIACPYGKPGGLLWVRETWMDLDGTGIEHYGKDQKRQRYAYGAESPSGSASDEVRKDFGLKWRPSIHMPRAASRLTLRITDVRAQQLHHMEGQHPSESDAIAEGVRAIHHGDGDYYYSAFRDKPHPKNWCDPTDAFRELWGSINGADSWAANPWVWAISFEVIQRNVNLVLTESAA